MKKTLVLIRHAHRDTTDRALNNGLSDKGLKQALRLREFAKSRFSKTEVHELRACVISSPLRRCLETVKPISDLWDVNLVKEMGLTETRPGEAFKSLTERVVSFMDWWVRSAPPLVFACSHGDWLPVASYHMLGSAIEMKKGGWLEMDWQGGQAHLRWYLPSFKYFTS